MELKEIENLFKNKKGGELSPSLRFIRN